MHCYKITQDFARKRRLEFYDFQVKYNSSVSRRMLVIPVMEVYFEDLIRAGLVALVSEAEHVHEQ